MWIYKLINLTILAVLFHQTAIAQNTIIQYDKYGDYNIPQLADWQFVKERSNESYYVFQYKGGEVEVGISKEPQQCADEQEFNAKILTFINGLAARKEYSEQRKISAPIAFLGLTSSHLINIKSRETGKKRFIYHAFKGNRIYEISVIEKALLNNPGDIAIQFLSFIYLSSEPDGKANALIAAEKLKKVRPADVAVRPATKVKEKDTKLDGFKKVKTPDVVEEIKNEHDGKINKVENKPSDIEQSVPDENRYIESPSLNIKMPEIKKSGFSKVNFKFTDPCVNTQNENTPWETKQKSNTNSDESRDPVQVPILPDIKNLSMATYRSAVGTVFENLRLVYGPMEEDEFRLFQSLWNPLFDYPSLEIVNYLNELNQLIFKYLALRESYLRIVGEIQMLWFDAAMAIEMQDRQTWNATTAELVRYANLLTAAENKSKSIAEQINILGNPPNPNMEKCKAQQRYRKFFNNTYSFEGEWKDDNGDISLIKTVYEFDDGRLFVYVYPFSLIEKMKSKGYNLDSLGIQNNPKELRDENEESMSIIPGVADLLYVFEEIEPNIWVALNIYSMLFDIYAYKFNPLSGYLEINHHIPTAYMSSGGTSGISAQKLNEITGTPPLLPSYKKNWDEFISEIRESGWAASNHKSYLERRNEDLIKIVVEGPTKERLRLEEYEEKKRKIHQNYEWKGGSEESKARELDQLENEYSDVLKDKSDSQKKTKTDAKPQQKPDENKANLTNTTTDSEELFMNTINFHKEMIAVIEHNLKRDIEDRDRIYAQLRNAKSEQEAKDMIERIKQFDLRIIHHQSNMQAEDDLIESHKTGEIVRTRTIFDDYASQRFIEGIRENAARMDATRRIADRIERQINLLPEEEREKARDVAKEVLDPKTIGSGDIDRAKGLVNAFNKKIQGYASFDHASAQLAEIDADATEYYGSLALAVVGAGAIGVGSAVLANTYGAQAAMTIYGTKILSAVYGGSTGLVQGGPGEGVQQAIAYWSPLTYATQEFVKGYRGVGPIQNASESDRIWNGVQQAGTALVLGKIFEYGTALASKGATIIVGKENWLAKPLLLKGASDQISKSLQDKIAQQRRTKAKDNIDMFKKLEFELTQLKKNTSANKSQIDRLEKNLQELAAEINLSYEAKWMMKYQVHPIERSRYDKRIKENIENLKPGITNRLREKGYIMDDIQFAHFRNGNSGGTSSMDFDLVPVDRRTGKEVKMIRKKDGTLETSQGFNKDAQNALDDEYFAVYKMNARASDIQITTAAHPEAFANARMLNHNVNFSSFTPEEVASVGKVLQVKITNLDKNKMLSATIKMQAKAREAAKEVENMLLRKLKSDLKNLKPGSSEHKTKQKDIEYWENMLDRLNTIGKQETDPIKLIDLNRELIHETGGRDVNGVIDDIINAFKK